MGSKAFVDFHLCITFATEFANQHLQLMTQEKIISTQIYHAPCADLLLGSYEGQLCLCDWLTDAKRSQTGRRLELMLDARMVDAPSDVIRQAAAELDEYFGGRRKVFSVPLLFVGTDFQKAVWNALLDVPFGVMQSYGWLAAKIGNPKAVRAVGLANGANDISIFAPCHRIIGSNGALTGYGGGLDNKRFLLALEGHLLAL